MHCAECGCDGGCGPGNGCQCEQCYDRTFPPPAAPEPPKLEDAERLAPTYLTKALMSATDPGTQSLPSRPKQCTIAAHSLHNHCSLTAQSQTSHCSIVVHSLHIHCTITAFTAHNERPPCSKSVPATLMVPRISHAATHSATQGLLNT